MYTYRYTGDVPISMPDKSLGPDVAGGPQSDIIHPNDLVNSNDPIVHPSFVLQ